MSPESHTKTFINRLERLAAQMNYGRIILDGGEMGGGYCGTMETIQQMQRAVCTVNPSVMIRRHWILHFYYVNSPIDYRIGYVRGDEEDLSLRQIKEKTR